jgi:tRNA dimethylallyltransferase
MTEPYKTLAICGPTAVGKSELSISMCHALQGEVVNVDSVQVYRELDIGSAKLSVEERGGVPHHALDVFGPDQVANVADFRAVAQEAIKDISNRQRLPVLVGGSGMYFTVLLHGLANVPRICTPSFSGLIPPRQSAYIHEICSECPELLR